MPIKKEYPDIPDRSRFWATEIYTHRIVLIDSCLRKSRVSCILSPLHDKDLKEHIDCICDREYLSYRVKKAHRHLMFLFPRAVGVASFHAVLKQLLHSNGIQTVGYECVFSEVGMARYFAHMDNPEKAQYNIDDILYYGCVNPSILVCVNHSKTDNTMLLDEFVDIIIQHRIESICDLVKYYAVADGYKIPEIHRLSAILVRYTNDMKYCNPREKEIKKMQKEKARIHYDNIRAIK